MPNSEGDVEEIEVRKRERERESERQRDAERGIVENERISKTAGEADSRGALYAES